MDNELNKKAIKLRLATTNDADLLLTWRNDPQTRSASHNTEEINRDEHISWFTKTLNNPNRQLFIAEEGGTPVGTVRADFSDGVFELSWTVAPASREKGIAKQMVLLLANQISGPIRAEIKAGNTASIKIAKYAGMEFEHEENGVLHYKRIK